jgi:rSAM/selenodomain-associated transferase 2
MSVCCVTVVIPTLNERENLPRAVVSAAAADEIIVADGGSDDDTREWARAQPGVRVVEAPRGRGAQLAAGARIATGDVLLFLHADCRLPGDAWDRIAAALADPRTVGGCFLVRFAETEPRSLAWTALAISLHSRFTKTATGDQAVFVRRAVYDAMEGFAPWPLFEDVNFVARLRRRGRFVVLPQSVTISARRWQTLGVGRTNLRMVLLWCGYRLGVPPAALKRWFADIRPARQP